MTEETYYDYFIFKGEGNIMGDEFLNESLNSIEEAEEFLKENSYDSYEGVIVPDKHHFICSFFYNDFSDYNQEEDYEVSEFASIKDALLYQESNNAGGHFQFVKSEEFKLGEGIINTILHDENLYPDEDEDTELEGSDMGSQSSPNSPQTINLKGKDYNHLDEGENFHELIFWSYYGTKFYEHLDPDPFWEDWEIEEQIAGDIEYRRDMEKVILPMLLRDNGKEMDVVEVAKLHDIKLTHIAGSSRFIDGCQEDGCNWKDGVPVKE